MIERELVELCSLIYELWIPNAHLFNLMQRSKIKSLFLAIHDEFNDEILWFSSVGAEKVMHYHALISIN